jgi:hypothetical protein
MKNLLAYSFVLAVAAGVGACADQKTAADDDFSSFAGMDEKSDSFSYRMKIVGSLDFGATSDVVHYTKTPRYRAFKFSGHEHDDVDVWVKSSNGGDAVAWVLDNSFKVLGSNDDANAHTSDAHITLKLPANASDTHYIVFRDYDGHNADFTVELGGGQAYDTSCASDSDCVAVSAGGCCPNGWHDAVNVGSVDAHAEATACTITPHPICPLAVIWDNRVAQCNQGTHQCEMVKPEDIRCGGFVMHPHSCPTNYTCKYTNVPDVPGTCTAN